MQVGRRARLIDYEQSLFFISPSSEMCEAGKQRLMSLCDLTPTIRGEGGGGGYGYFLESHWDIYKTWTTPVDLVHGPLWDLVHGIAL